jgi:hypothetical protein
VDDKDISGSATRGGAAPSSIRERGVEITDGLHGNVFQANLIEYNVCDGNEFGVNESKKGLKDKTLSPWMFAQRRGEPVVPFEEVAKPTDKRPRSLTKK